MLVMKELRSCIAHFLHYIEKYLSVLCRDSLEEVKTFKMWVIFLKHAQTEFYFFVNKVKKTKQTKNISIVKLATNNSKTYSTSLQFAFSDRKHLLRSIYQN